MKIELKGIEQFKRDLNKVKSEITRKLERTTSASLLRIQSEAKRKATVGTPESTGKKGYAGGRLRAAIHFRQKGTDGEVAVYDSVHYAPYVEFGTGNLVRVPDELKELAEQFRGRGIRQVNLPARPFMYPAFVKERPVYIRNLKNVLGRSRTV